MPRTNPILHRPVPDDLTEGQTAALNARTAVVLNSTVESTWSWLCHSLGTDHSARLWLTGFSDGLDHANHHNTKEGAHA